MPSHLDTSPRTMHRPFTWRLEFWCKPSSSLPKVNCSSACGLLAPPLRVGDTSWDGVGVTSKSSLHSASSAKPPEPLLLPWDHPSAPPLSPVQPSISLLLLVAVSVSERSSRWSAMVRLANLDLLRVPAAAVAAAAASLMASRPYCKFAKCS